MTQEKELLITRLIKEGHISFQEGQILAQKEQTEIKFVPLTNPNQLPSPWPMQFPYNPTPYLYDSTPVNPLEVHFCTTSNSVKA